VKDTYGFDTTGDGLYNLSLIDALNQDAIVLQTINAGSIFYATFNGPHNEDYLQSVNVNLNINMYADGSGEIIEGSFYPDVNAVDCVSQVQVLPITDDLAYGEIPDANYVNPGVNIIGLPSQTTFAGQGGFGGVGLSQSVIFDYFPAVPTQTSIPFDVVYGDLNGDGEITPGVESVPAGYTLPGYAMGLFRKSGETEDSFVPGNTQRDLYLEWHAVDGEVSQSGFGDDPGVDEDDDGTDYDRIFGLPYITQTCIDPAVGLGLNHCIFGDASAAFIAAGVPAGFISVGTGTDGYVMDPSGALANWSNYLTYNGFAWDLCLSTVSSTVEGMCQAAGGPAGLMTGICVETVTGADFAAACGYYGWDVALVGACMELGLDQETCAGAAGEAGAAIEAYCQYLSGGMGDCAAIGVSYCDVLANPSFAGATCGAVAAGAVDGATDCGDWVDSFDIATLDAFATQANGASCTDLFGADDSDHDFDYEGDFTFLDGTGTPCNPLLGDPTCATPYSANGGRLVMHFDPTCVPELEVREVMVEFVQVGDGGGCTANGDANQDGGLSVLDVVVTINHILGAALLTDDGACAADISGDGILNVLDVVQIVNAILAGGKVVNDPATSAELIKTDNAVSFIADGTVNGFEITLEHGADFSIELTENAYAAEYFTSGNVTKLVVINPVNDELFTTNGDFEVKDVIAATPAGYVETSVSTPSSFAISSAYPNPFNPTTTFDISLTVDSDVSVKVYNVMGQLVDVIAEEGSMASGTYTLTWDAASLSSGVYFIKTQVGSLIDNQKVMLLK